MRESEQIQDTYEYSNGELAALLGERFRKYRNSLGLSQKDVALQSGVSVMTIVRFEKGQGNSIRLDIQPYEKVLLSAELSPQTSFENGRKTLITLSALPTHSAGWRYSPPITLLSLSLR